MIRRPKIGRPPNKLRAAALKAGKLVYTAAAPCKRCRTRLRYVVNSGCVHCAVKRGCARYDAIKDDGNAKAHYNRHHYVDQA
jgi:hypothetical protein